MSLWWLAAALAATGAWQDLSSDASVDFGPDWTWELGGTLLEEQVLQAVHVPTGGGAALRLVPTSLYFDPVPANAERRIGGQLDAALTPDRFARVIALGQEDDSAERTVYLGMSDTQGARVGRWVFFQPGEDEPDRWWWHVFWRTPEHFAQLVAWVPRDGLAPFAVAMRGLEAGVGTVSDWRGPEPLLYTTRMRGCEGPAMADRMAAVAASESFARAKRALASDGWTANSRLVGELRAVSAMLEGMDECVRKEAPGVRACEVLERDSSTQRSARLQEELPACLDGHKLVQRALATALSPPEGR